MKDINRSRSWLTILNVNYVESVTRENTSKEEQKQFLEQLSLDIVKLKDNNNNHNVQNPEPNTCVPFGNPGCPKTFEIGGQCRAKHRLNCIYKDFPEQLNEHIEGNDECIINKRPMGLNALT